MRTRVKDVMTTDVVTATPATPFKELARLLTGHGLSALPVVEAGGRVVGVVSEADLLLKTEYHPHDDISLLERARHHTDRARAEGTVAEDIMSGSLVTIGPEATVAETAKLLHARRVKRLPVVDDDGRLVGIVSRADLLRVFLRPDDQIRREILEDVIRRNLRMDPERFQVEVLDGKVNLRGRCGLRSLIPLLIRLVEGLDGVVEVDAQLDYDFDDNDPDLRAAVILRGDL